MKITYTEALIKMCEEGNCLDSLDYVYGKAILAAVSENHNFIRYIGAGLEGVLLLAEDVKNMRRVVFKFAKPKLDTGKKIFGYKNIKIFSRRNKNTDLKETGDSKRFLRACKLQQEISRIIRNDAEIQLIGDVPIIYQIGNIPKLYVEMEYIPGADLLSWCKAEQSLYKRVEIIYKLSIFINKALHLNYIVHGDLKPNNFIITGTSDNYKIHVIDFGGTKNLKETIEVTQDECMHSVPFTSKNQYTNFIGRSYIDDLYSIGVMLYYCVIQKNPAEQVADFPDAKTFKELHPQRLIDDFTILGCFNRAVGIGLKYTKLQTFIDDLDKRYLKIHKKTEKKQFNFIQIEDIWRDFLGEKT